MSPSPLESAGPLHVIRAYQRDKEHIDKIKEDFLSLTFMRRFSRRKWKEIVEHLIPLAYYSLTNLQRLQTLGEEYTGILQVKATKDSIPSTSQQILAIIVNVFGIKFLKTLLDSVTASTTSNERASIPIPVFQNVIAVLKQLHVSLFLYQRTFYEFSKRLAGIYLILVRKAHQRHEAQMSRTLDLLTKLTLLNSLIVVLDKLQQLWRWTRQQSEQLQQPLVSAVGDDDVVSAGENQCVLCLEPRKNPTLTTCGHIFCWNCILDWLRTKPECPVCREELHPFRVVALQNFT